VSVFSPTIDFELHLSFAERFARRAAERHRAVGEQPLLAVAEMGARGLAAFLRSARSSPGTSPARARSAGASAASCAIVVGRGGFRASDAVLGAQESTPSKRNRGGDQPLSLS